MLEVCNSAEMCDLTPHLIVAILADRGEYIGSTATMYRILAEEQMVKHRLRSKPSVTRLPNMHSASAPNQLYSWDITFLPSLVRGEFFKAYVFMDIYSRKIVGAEVYERECSSHARDLLFRICAEEQVSPELLTLHSDNGAPMKGGTLLALLQSLGVVPCYSRPSVSNDNAYSESLFRTLKYCPKYPVIGFEALDGARAWLKDFVHWYNNEHLHSGIKYVTPSQRHSGEERQILEGRSEVFAVAREKHPERWSGNTRDWSPIETVTLNKHRETGSRAVN